MLKLSDIDVTSPEFIQNPYPYYEVLVEQAPVYFDSKTGLYFVTSYPVLQQVLMDTTTFSSIPDGSIWGIYSTHPDVNALYDNSNAHRPLNTLVTTDPPVHRRYRSLVEKAVSAYSVSKMREDIANTANSLIDGFIADGKCDFQQEFALRLPVQVIAKILGFPDESWPFIQNASDATVILADARFITHEQLLAGHQVQIDTQQYFQPFIDASRRNPGDDLLGHLVSACSEEYPVLTDREIHSALQALFVGGNDSTPAAIGNTMLLLCKNPEFEPQLRESPKAIANFCEESLRVESPVPGLYRFTTVDTELAGVKIPAGSGINVRYAAANRDKSVFPNPDKIDLSRKGIRNHFALGGGIHFCLGANLARMEMVVSLESVINRLTNIRLAIPEADIEYVKKFAIRGFLNLPILFDQI
jgi:cytochrome P450